ncbi:subtilase family protein [Cereibacter ovatus]|uniref:Subtilase family protein n=1 Tax=Cereibacter ovatus TaxID=439529 RepID=A0A285CU49_9RHOB|nr:S8 family serine peptidase [Cereibacter ovatus]SNX71062.1 subtilase family protein [Cereibacter ovatus]
MTPSVRTLDLHVGGRRFSLPRDLRRCGVIYDDRLARTDRLRLEQQTLGATPALRFEVPGQRITLLDASETPAGTRFGPLGAETALGAQPEVAATFPVFQLADKLVLLAPMIVVGFDPMATDAAAIVAGTILRIRYQARDHAVLTAPAEADVLAEAEALTARPGVLFAEPDLITIGANLRPPPPGFMAFDSAAGVQRAFLNIRAPAAWPLAGPLDAIRIAVLDDGVDLSHPALAAAVVGSFDAIEGTEGPVSPNAWDYHGTSCAGLALGLGAGFRGVAGGARLLAVRIARSPGPGQPWATSNSVLRRGIDWAVDQGADVISNSWGGPPSSVVAEGIARASGAGRDGRGAVVAVAAGNSGGPVAFPANLSGVIAVAAVNLADEPKTWASSDGESWWASNMGPEVDLAAPGIGLTTTDLQAAPGRTPTDWRQDFNGTSAACPIVAGAAALILSRAPHLTAPEVAAVLIAAADPIGSAQRRLNVERAMTALAPAPTPDLPPPEITGRCTRLVLSEAVSVFHLAPADGGAALFLADPGDLAALIAAEAVGVDLTLRYRDSVAGPLAILKGARLRPAVGAPPDPDPAPEPDPDPDKVLLPRPEDDIFATA